MDFFGKSTRVRDAEIWDESCRLDDSGIPGNVGDTAFPGVLWYLIHRLSGIIEERLRGISGEANLLGGRLQTAFQQESTKMRECNDMIGLTDITVYKFDSVFYIGISFAL